MAVRKVIPKRTINYRKAKEVEAQTLSFIKFIRLGIKNDTIRITDFTMMADVKECCNDFNGFTDVTISYKRKNNVNKK